ncbi:hypothetical protein ANANG_G00175490 [Anguilla anguilla]|uniref:Uncharacterized protein n=1 Tax=Anguilla anguilla TaxID=7936 RepID=A0A9D3RSY1_ANGAN|nr:hypothetical protein ANANG_G00175490 [Anguilla anguilla]
MSIIVDMMGGLVQTLDGGGARSINYNGRNRGGQDSCFHLLDLQGSHQPIFREAATVPSSPKRCPVQEAGEKGSGDSSFARAGRVETAAQTPGTF